MSIIWWSEKERNLLKNLYPESAKDNIIKALKNKTWYAIQKEASRLGIKRTTTNRGRPKKTYEPASPSLKLTIKKKTLNRLFNEQGLTVDEIALKLKVDPDIVRRCIWRYNL